MENTHTFTFTVNVGECSESYGEYGMFSKSGAEALEMFTKALEAYGMEVAKESHPRGRATISIRHPEHWEAERLRNRGGGRRKKGVSSTSPLSGLDDAQVLEWLESHTVTEGMEALGCSKRTYYRRLESLRGKEGK